ncbi:MAG: hypothetical protein QOF32_2450, partial [Gammaproteobacteria bacterium]|nr:hypothetical protein [Gammaproteobacteria bacterium]
GTILLVRIPAINALQRAEEPASI